MPIKFRCNHCDQLLGISRSRASAVVDCPQCGRSLRVPELDGRTRRLPDPQSAAKADSTLLSALTELSVLDQDACETEAEGAENQAGPGTPEAAGRAVSLAPIPASEPIEVEISRAADPDVCFESGEPIAIAESLNELAALESQTAEGQVSEDVHRDMREVSHGQQGMAGLLLSGIVILLLGICLGWWVGHRTSDSEGSADAPADILPLPATDTLLKAAPAEDGLTVQGRIEYQDASGAMNPDTGATVLLLPVDRQGTIKLHARSLKRPAGDPDLVATVAALSALGGAVGLVDGEGTYQLTSAETADCMLIVVSKHLERPDDLPPAPSVVQSLESWFDSANHIMGRLATRSVRISQQPSDASSTDIQFRAER